MGSRGGEDAIPRSSSEYGATIDAQNVIDLRALPHFISPSKVYQLNQDTLDTFRELQIRPPNDEDVAIFLANHILKQNHPYNRVFDHFVVLVIYVCLCGLVFYGGLVGRSQAALLSAIVGILCLIVPFALTAVKEFILLQNYVSLASGDDDHSSGVEGCWRSAAMLIITIISIALVATAALAVYLLLAADYNRMSFRK